MKIFDLSHPIHQNMPFFPSSEPPVIIQNATIKNNGYAEKIITFHSHTGTHIDAPGHIVGGGKTLDKLPLSMYSGKGLVINIADINSKEIETEFLKKFSDQILQSDFLLFNTGWSDKWGKDNYFENFPVLSIEATEWLMQFNLKGIGIDAISVDPIDSKTLPIHQILLSNELIIIENLTNLKQLVNKEFSFSCFPLPIKEADGSPVRAIATVL